MSLNLQVEVKDLVIGKYDQMKPEKWREETLRTVGQLNVDHMFTGNYVLRQEGGEDPYLKIYEDLMKLEQNQNPSGNQKEAYGSEEPTSGDLPKVPRDEFDEGSSSVSDRGDVELTLPYREQKILDTSTATSSAGLLGFEFAGALLKKGLEKRRIYYRVINGTEIKEPDSERKKRNILWKLMVESIRGYPHLRDGIADLDVQSLWAKVCTNAQPNKRELMVNYIRILVNHTKEQRQGFSDWHTQLQKVWEDLETVEFSLPETAKLGFLFFLMHSDSRYHGVLERCRDNEWDYATCMAKFNQKSIELKDTKVLLENSRQRINSVRKARTEKISCTFWMKYGNCKYGDQCKFAHHEKEKGTKRKNTKEPQGQAKEAPLSEEETAKVIREYKEKRAAEAFARDGTVGKTPDSEKTCFVWRDTRNCPQADRCRFKHSE